MKKIFFYTLMMSIGYPTIAQHSIENLGSKVNSKYSEIRPTISADGKTLYFVIEGNPKNTMFKQDKLAQDVWVSKLDENGEWSQAVQESSPINTPKDNAVFWVSPNGNRVLIRGAFENGKYIGRGISVSNKTEEGWSQPEKLNIKGYNRMAVDKFSGASMANDGKTLLLYFSEERNSFLNDIYVSHLQEDGNWSKPIKTGTINTDDYDEISPFLASDGLTIYFSSDRPDGKGGYDIWMAKRLDESWTKWTDPINLGDSVNSIKWDGYFTIDAKGEYGYFATTRNSIGGTDIVKIKLDDSLKPKSVALVYGKVYNAITKQPMDASLFYDKIPGETEEGNAISFVDGSYKVTLPYGKVYSLRASANNYFSMLDTLDLTIENPYKELHRDLYLYPVVNDGKLLYDSMGNIVRKNLDSIAVDDSIRLASGSILTTKQILFDSGKSTLPPSSIAELDNAAKKMKDDPSLKIELSVTDNANNKNNESAKLEEDRALVLRQYLISKGIDPDRIIAEGDANNSALLEGLILTTNKILFDFGKSIIRSESYYQLEKVAKLMKYNPNMMIELSAHTDAIGKYSDNLKLSDDRANASRQYLLSKGIDASRIIAKGYGETTPVATNKTDEGRQLNRRVEFRILQK
jgi:outer membrane protein OmpA-like peptidoglycan-associated protein